MLTIAILSLFSSMNGFVFYSVASQQTLPNQLQARGLCLKQKKELSQTTMEKDCARESRAKVSDGIA